jgi:hypothetical protein
MLMHVYQYVDIDTNYICTPTYLDVQINLYHVNKAE